jgi:hypothetical protein
MVCRIELKRSEQPGTDLPQPRSRSLDLGLSHHSGDTYNCTLTGRESLLLFPDTQVASRTHLFLYAQDEGATLSVNKYILYLLSQFPQISSVN